MLVRDMEWTPHVRVMTGAPVTYDLQAMKPGEHRTLEHEPEQVIHFVPPQPDPCFFVTSGSAGGRSYTAVYRLA